VYEEKHYQKVLSVYNRMCSIGKLFDEKKWSHFSTFRIQTAKQMGLLMVAVLEVISWSSFVKIDGFSHCSAFTCDGKPGVYDIMIYSVLLW